MYTTRYRSTDETTPTLLKYSQRVGEGEPYVPGEMTISSHGLSRSIHDVPHKNFHKLKREGRVIMGDMLLTVNDKVVTPGTLSYSNDGYGINWIGDFAHLVEHNCTGGSFELDQYQTQMEQIALVKAYAKMNQSNLLGGEALATLGQTVEMLRSPLKKSLKLVTKIVKRRDRLLRKSSNIVTANANAWLEYRYGWQPLLLDCKEIMHLIAKEREKVVVRSVARAGEKVERERSFPFVSQPLVAPNDHSVNWVFDATGSQTWKQSLRSNAGVMFEVKPQNMSQNIVAALGLRARDIPATVWELIPLSFVADWFIGVGDWLQAVTPVPNITPLANWVTTVNERTRTLNSGTLHYYWPTTPPMDAYGSYGSSVDKTTTVTRKCNQPLPPLPSVQAPGLSTLHTIDGCALLANKIVAKLLQIRR